MPDAPTAPSQRPSSHKQSRFSERLNRKTISWAMYDWANSAFATTVIAAMFPIFFKKFWSEGIDPQVSTFYLGAAHAITSALLAVFAPVLGFMADRGSKKKLFVFAFLFLGVITTASLSLVEQGGWPLAVGLFVFANIGFAGANSLYDSLLVAIAKPKDVDFVSAFGFALGYLGGGLLFLLNVLMVTKPYLFGFADAASATRWSFVSVGLWWAAFSIPLFLFVPEPSEAANSVDRVQSQISPPSTSTRMANELKAIFRQFILTFGKLRKHPTLLLFLIAYFCYIEGVNTIIKMAADYGMAIGLQSTHLIQAILLVQFVGFPATLAFGFLAARIGPKISIMACILVYGATTIYAYFLSTESEFYLLAVLIGLVQGGVQSQSRSFYARLVPPGQAGEFFGFYNMLGKFSSVLGPLLVGTVGLISRDPRLAILSVLVLFVSGGAILARVPVAHFKES